jgi:DNA-binding CsgD family transcriptional regulator
MLIIEEKRFIELLDQAKQLDTIEKSNKFVHLMKEAYSFDHVSFATFDEKSDTYLRVSGTYPSKWTDYYWSKPNREKHDPILRHLKKHRPFIWADMTELSSEERELMQASYRFGVGPNGFTIPFLSSDGHMSLLSATQREISADDWKKKVTVLKSDLVEIGSILHAALLRRAGVMPPSITLSERSLACLKLKGCGMNEEQIANTLKISQRAVKSYLKSAREATSARNNEQAITFAFRLKFIPLPGQGQIAEG